MPALDVVLIGAGNRGRYTFARFASRQPERLRVVALAESRAERREVVARELSLPAERCFADWRALFSEPQLAPAAIIATPDTEHVEPALAAIAAGYDVLLEKPMAPDPADCVRVVEAAERAGRGLQICHVLRYTPFYERVFSILSSGALGDLVAIDMKEHVAYWHMTHSYVRGKWRNRGIAAPILLAKSCHDLDLMTWFAGSPAARVSSFGSLRQFRRECAPEGAPERCTDGCPVQASCIHDAVAFYTGPDERIARLWPWSDLGDDPSREARRRALESGPWGRCVYRCDNDQPDRQVVAIEFENGLAGTFTVQGFGTTESRTLRITGSRGELRGVLDRGEIEVTQHGSTHVEQHDVASDVLEHHGGDAGLLEHFTSVASGGVRGETPESKTSGRISLESHLIGFAAEQARLEGRTVEMAAFREGVTARATRPA